MMAYRQRKEIMQAKSLYLEQRKTLKSTLNINRIDIVAGNLHGEAYCN